MPEGVLFCLVQMFGLKSAGPLKKPWEQMKKMRQNMHPASKQPIAAIREIFIKG